MKASTDKSGKQAGHKTDLARVAARVAAHLCSQCGNVEVVDRKICVECCQRASSHNAISGFRKVLRLAGIANPTDLLPVLEAVKHNGNADKIGALINAIEACEYKIHRRETEPA